MLEWFRSKPSCPVSNEDKAWIEDRFSWLIDEFGIQQLKKTELVLPTTDFFPAEYDYTEDGIGDIMNRIAKFMEVDPSLLHLEFYEHSLPQIEGMWKHGTAVLYSESDGQFDIWLEVNTLEDPLNVVATLAHEIGHVVLLGQRRISPEEEDHEPLTDLLTVFFGLGTFSANCVVHENYWNDGQWSGWSIGRRGYLTMEMYGYAFALFALARGETSPNWLSYLRLDVRSAYKKGIRFINETGDCNCSFITTK